MKDLEEIKFEDFVEFLKSKNVYKEFVKNAQAVFGETTSLENIIKGTRDSNDAKTKWVGSFFKWKESPEGLDFWRNIEDDWFDYLGITKAEQLRNNSIELLVDKLLPVVVARILRETKTSKIRECTEVEIELHKEKSIALRNKMLPTFIVDLIDEMDKEKGLSDKLYKEVTDKLVNIICEVTFSFEELEKMRSKR
ncbi:MAG: hypothetical protein ACOC2U_02005 [bacterium]